MSASRTPRTLESDVEDYDPRAFCVELVHIVRERETVKLNGRKMLVLLDLRPGSVWAQYARRALNLKFMQLTTMDGANRDTERANYQLRITLDTASIPGYEGPVPEPRYWSPDPDDPDDDPRRRRRR